MTRLPREIDQNFPRGRLFGRVTCTQTGSPLAGATISLQGAPPSIDEVFGIRTLGVTDANGNFDFRAVLAWTYYIFAKVPGYAYPASHLSQSWGCLGVRDHFNAPEPVLDAALDKVTVTPEAATEINLTLAVGGTISGKVSWQDGTPAARNQMKLILVDGDKRRDHSFRSEQDAHAYGTETDDKGNYRFKGLYTGKYVVGARAPKLLDYVRKNLMWNGVPPTMNCASFYYWTGNTPNLADAVPIDVESAVDVSNVDLTLPMLRPNT